MAQLNRSQNPGLIEGARTLPAFRMALAALALLLALPAAALESGFDFPTTIGDFARGRARTTRRRRRGSAIPSSI